MTQRAGSNSSAVIGRFITCTRYAICPDLEERALGWLERTDYPHLESSLESSFVLEFFTPAAQELDFVLSLSDIPAYALSAMLLLKSFQLLRYFPRLQNIPESAVRQVRQALGWTHGCCRATASSPRRHATAPRSARTWAWARAANPCARRRWPRCAGCGVRTSRSSSTPACTRCWPRAWSCPRSARSPGSRAKCGRSATGAWSSSASVGASCRS
jgi:hypothetical protein